MAHVSEARRPVLRVAKISARLAAILLLFVWVGPVTFVQTDAWQLLKWVGAPERASADSRMSPRVIPAGEAVQLEPGTFLKLRLRDGSVVHGRFLGRTLLDSALYVPRFEARSLGSSFVPFALGETLHVSLRDGREWTAPFAGYGELALLLRSSDDSTRLRVPFEFAKEIRRANGDRVEPRDLARAFQAHRLPSAEALAIEGLNASGDIASRWAGTLRVAVEDIRTVTAELATGTGSAAAGFIVLGVLVGVVLFIVLLAAAFHSSSSGCSGPSEYPPILTTRPFDRSRGCFVGDPLAVADPWPGATEAGPAITLADRGAPYTLAK